MKGSLLVSLGFLGVCPLFAEWTISQSEALAAPAAVEFVRAKVVEGERTAEMHYVRFNPKTFTLAVMDNPAGDFTLATAARRRSAVAAVNGGYFTPDRTPLGLVVRQGKTLHALQRAKLLSGIVAADRNRIALLRVAEFKSSANPREALQAGPFLIDRGKIVAGLNDRRSAARTVVFLDGGGHCGLLICRYVTLAEMAEVLAGARFGGDARIARALNLDGGSSTGLWVKSDPEFYLREGKEVRNYLGVVPRPE